MSTLKSLMKLPIIGSLLKFYVRFRTNQEATSIAVHFSEFLKPLIADNAKLRESVYSIRHHVYCDELKFEPQKPNKQEIDDFDRHSFHCLIQHRSSSKYAGTVRVVCSNQDDELLPLEKYCLDSIDHPDLTPSAFPRSKICEISRLAVPAEYRRRASDKFAGAATGVINETVYSETELRCFPFIAVGLYLSAASVCVERGIEHVFVMMEPRLARSLRFVGIEFEQIGPVVDYHGERAPYYIDPKSLKETLSPGFKALYKNIRQQFDIKA